MSCSWKHAAVILLIAVALAAGLWVLKVSLREGGVSSLAISPCVSALANPSSVASAASQPATSSAEAERANLHIIYQVGCSAFSLHQGIALDWSWQEVQQPGQLTRIVTGCSSFTESERMKASPLFGNPRFHVFYSQDWNSYVMREKSQKVKGDSYPPYNKAYGVEDWLRRATYTEDFVMLMEADMLFHSPVLYHVPHATSPTLQRGKPIAQHYHYVKATSTVGDPGWGEFALKEICGSDCPSVPSEADNLRSFAVGPPQLMHRDDWAQILGLWGEYSVEVRVRGAQKDSYTNKWTKGKVYIAEMLAYSLAVAQRGLPHQVVRKLAVDMLSLDGEPGMIWHYCFSMNLQTPIGHWMWNKYRPPFGYGHKGQEQWNIPLLVDCDMPLFAEPALNSTRMVKHHNSVKQLRMISEITRLYNAAFWALRRQFCSRADLARVRRILYVNKEGWFIPRSLLGDLASTFPQRLQFAVQDDKAGMGEAIHDVSGLIDTGGATAATTMTVAAARADNGAEDNDYTSESSLHRMDPAVSMSNASMEVERFDGGLRGYLGGLSSKCVGGEGTGQALAKLGGVLSMCVRFNLSYVCEPLDWSTRGHNTGRVGDLFGCSQKGVVGDRSRIVSKANVRNAPVKHIGFKYLTSSYGDPETISSHASVSLVNETEILLVKPGTPLPLYRLSKEKRCAETNLGEARPWIAGQYNRVRVNRHFSVPKWEGAAWRILLYFRRGDRYGASVASGVNLLRNLFYAAPWLDPNNSRIVVLAEIEGSDPEMQPLLAFSNLRLLCRTEQQTLAKNHAKLIHDLDYAATANILLSTGGGSFGTLMTAVMAEGIAITVAKSWEDPSLKWPGNVGAIAKPDGRFPCAYDIAGTFVAHGATTGNPDVPAPYSATASKTTLMKQSEKAFKALRRFYAGQRNWNHCTHVPPSKKSLKGHPCHRVFTQDVDYSLPHLSPCQAAHMSEIQWMEKT